MVFHYVRREASKTYKHPILIMQNLQWNYILKMSLCRCRTSDDGQKVIICSMCEIVISINVKSTTEFTSYTLFSIKSHHRCCCNATSYKNETGPYSCQHVDRHMNIHWKISYGWNENFKIDIHKQWTVKWRCHRIYIGLTNELHWIPNVIWIHWSNESHLKFHHFRNV